MAHFLYRPHIAVGAKVVTTDFLIDQVVLRVEAADGAMLPVDLLSCAVEFAAGPERALVAPCAFVFAGDEEQFAAPALAVLDPHIHAHQPALAWRNARVSVSRRALPLAGGETMRVRFEGRDAVEMPPEILSGAGRRRAALCAGGEPRQQPVPRRVTLSLSGAGEAAHQLLLTPLQTALAA